MPPTQCPPEEELSAFLFGRADESLANAVGDHVRACAACQTTLNACNEQQDTIVATLKHSDVQPEFDKEPELQGVLHQISELWSGGGHPHVRSPATVVKTATTTKTVRLGPYQLIELLGEGGMGTVYKAEHTRLEKTVAVKVLSDRLANNPQAIARFDREMKAVGKVDHPNIVRATDAGEQDGRHYLTMEFVDGTDLHRIVHCHGPLSTADACEAVRQAALGIEHAHSLGLIHRDLKPSNLMVSRGGKVKVLDLGLARLRAPKAGDAGITDDFQVMGTADYMPPEQATKATEVDHRVDIYSLGCTLYTLLCGQPPFSGPEYDEPLKKLIAHDRDEPTAVIQRCPDVPLELSLLIDKTLAKSPIDRLGSAAELAEALQPFTAGSDLAALVAKVPQTERTQGVTSDVAKHVAMTDTIASQRRSNAVSNAAGRRTRIGLVIAICLLLGGVFAASLVLRFRDGEGTIVVEIEGDQVAGAIDNGELLIEDKQGRNTYRLAVRGRAGSRRLRPGEYKIQVVNDAAGLHLLATEFTIKRNDRTVVKAYI